MVQGIQCCQQRKRQERHQVHKLRRAKYPFCHCKTSLKNGNKSTVKAIKKLELNFTIWNTPLGKSSVSKAKTKLIRHLPKYKQTIMVWIWYYFRQYSIQIKAFPWLPSINVSFPDHSENSNKTVILRLLVHLARYYLKRRRWTKESWWSSISCHYLKPSHFLHSLPCGPPRRMA